MKRFWPIASVLLVLLLVYACSNSNRETPVSLIGVGSDAITETFTDTGMAIVTSTAVTKNMNSYTAVATDTSMFVPGGYLFVTFKGESTPKTEQIYFGLSLDGITWEAQNNAEPVLVSNVGEKGVRDHYILRSHDGNKFYLIATDLSINLNSNWTRATNSGSKSIVVWESKDLVVWSTPRLVKVSPDNAGCTWAPEAIYDEKANDYLVYWASTTSSDSYAKQRIWSAHTTDFTVFSKPEIYIERPASIIDADIVYNAGKGGDNKYYRFYKDDYTDKSIVLEVADQLTGPWVTVSGFTLNTSQDVIRHLEGPAAFLRYDSKTQKSTWCLMLDYPGQGYRAYTTTDLASGKFTLSSTMKFPYEFRHGSILPLSSEEYQRVKSGKPLNTGVIR